MNSILWKNAEIITVTDQINISIFTDDSAIAKWGVEGYKVESIERLGLGYDCTHKKELLHSLGYDCTPNAMPSAMTLHLPYNSKAMISGTKVFVKRRSGIDNFCTISNIVSSVITSNLQVRIYSRNKEKQTKKYHKSKRGVNKWLSPTMPRNHLSAVEVMPQKVEEAWPRLLNLLTHHNKNANP